MNAAIDLSEACCTCAALLSLLPPTVIEKQMTLDCGRRLECCGRAICSRCAVDYPRFNTYCPFCQISITPSPLPQRLRDPPSYEEGDKKPTARSPDDDGLPPYIESGVVASSTEEKHKPGSGDDVLHFVCPEHDTVSSLSLRYGVPAWALRRKNNLFTDHLLVARKVVLIPGEFYKGGVSLSPRPPDGEEEERRKTTLRRFMMTCKVPDYDVAKLYLKQAHYDLNLAIGVYQDDERWEKENPFERSKKECKSKLQPWTRNM